MNAKLKCLRWQLFSVSSFVSARASAAAARPVRPLFEQLSLTSSADGHGEHRKCSATLVQDESHEFALFAHRK